MALNNGIPNDSLKYLHLLKPIILDIKTETSTDQFRYTEDEEKRSYRCYKGFAIRRLIDSSEGGEVPVLMWEASNPSHYAVEILKFGTSLKTREVCLSLVNGDFRIFAKKNNLWLRNDKITLDISKCYTSNEFEFDILGSDTSKTRYTALEFETILNTGYYRNYVATYNHLFNKIIDSVDNDGLGTVIWEANNPFECAKDVSFYNRNDKKYLGILLVNYNYLLFKWSTKSKNWTNITDNRVNLSNFKYRTDVESVYNYIQDISLNYSVSLYYLRYCICFTNPNNSDRIADRFSERISDRYSDRFNNSDRYSDRYANSDRFSGSDRLGPERHGIREKILAKCLIYDLVKNTIKIRFTNGKSVSVDLDDTEIKLYLENTIPKSKRVKYASWPESHQEYPKPLEKSGKPITLDINDSSDKHKNCYKFGEISKFECKKGFKFTKIIESSEESNLLIWSSENNEFTKQVVVVNDITKYIITLVNNSKCLVFRFSEEQTWENISHLGIDLAKFKFYDKNYNPIDTSTGNSTGSSTGNCTDGSGFETCIRSCDLIITFNVECHMVEYQNTKLWSLSENSDYEKLNLICINLLIHRLNLFFINQTVRRFIINDSNITFISEDISSYSHNTLMS
ncbi:hypothetical protein TpMuguga_04g00819 [Theileria parva strain Muguga]|uniref:Uncharacterized protein n=1 Tax=Theileria parva TaxID=5875 RepID=Q4N1C7_THEPA|nr:uncharacterized protein TpMuguga_04g00819 [Theileria parva strain Muguga]EAN32173.1 hypothetical protein TpMuguga_04g00819 [Theileria parva strain Muguga]|eukprot:XP_764456.1 hypothetical protein [Theileria parva strain Muguga]